MSTKSKKTKQSKQSLVIPQCGEVQEMDKNKSPYGHVLSDTVEGWDALTRRIEDLKKRADKIHLSYLMTEEDVAAFLSLNPKWRGERRTAGKPPVYYKFGTGQTAPVRYSLPEVMDFLMMCCRRQSTSEELILDIDLAEALYMDKYGRKTGEQILSQPSCTLF